ncbi:hypothetical protein D4764_21G0004690 [Takifugu flavidus]|uniref:Uncharacterized protein n=1 Tax=Takifugu flavidus TaxID=433684 RepID=A0A5C6NFY4_9TELE|nr:hypothetical protein D4764_21G0004690 [Takifugu flavidus]
MASEKHAEEFCFIKQLQTCCHELPHVSRARSEWWLRNAAQAPCTSHSIIFIFIIIFIIIFFITRAALLPVSRVQTLPVPSEPPSNTVPSGSQVIMDHNSFSFL